METGTPLVGPSWAATSGGLEPAIPPSAAPDDFLNGIFSNELGPGWVGGDATYSTLLPDGRVAFVFSDTLIGTSQTSGVASITGMPHSSELVGDLPNLTADYVGTYGAPKTLIPDTVNSQDEWQIESTYSVGGQQLIFVNQYAAETGVSYETYTGTSGIAVMSVQEGGMPTLNSIILLPTDPDTQWGNAVMQVGSYTYVYGSDLDAATSEVIGMKVARVPTAQSLDTSLWTYWNGAAWVGGESNATPVPSFNQLTGVTPDPDGHGFIAVSVAGGVENDNTIDFSYAVSPVGPWTTPEPIYTIPQIAEYQDETAYMPTFHPELSSPAVLVVSYNINTTTGLTTLLENVHTYQPQFILVSG